MAAKKPKGPEFVAKVEGAETPAPPEFVAGEEEKPAVSVEDQPESPEAGSVEDQPGEPLHVAGEDLDAPLPCALQELPAGKPWFRVSLGNNGPTSHHQADDSAEAWELYKKRHGILASAHIAEVTKLIDPDTVARVEAEEAQRLKR